MSYPKMVKNFSLKTQKILFAIVISVMTAIALNCHADAVDLPRPPEATHGMVVLGEQDNIYLIHLAMKSFEAHNFQLIMEVEFQKETETSLGDTRFLDEGENLTNTSPICEA